MKTIIVQKSDDLWTMEAMHLACALARNIDGRITLLHLVLAKNPNLLGWELTPPTAEEYQRMEEYAAIAEDYGVDFCLQPMQFVSLTDALVQAAEQLEASTLFAHIPQSSVPFWKRFSLWYLRRQLGGCHLYTLEEEQPLSTKELVSPAAVWEQ